MARIYGTDLHGKRKLLWLTCDYCDEKIKPNPKISESGWEKTVVKADDRIYDYYACPAHAGRDRIRY